MRDRLRDLGRSVADFGADLTLPPGGGVRALSDQVEAWRAAGGTHVSVITMGLGLDSVDAHIDYLVSVADALL